MKLRDRITRLLAGRNGFDRLGQDLFYFYVVLLLAGLFWKPLYYLTLVLAVYIFFRIFSRNLVARQRENARYWEKRRQTTGWFLLQKKKRKERKTFRYRTCPHCRATLRLPNRKGRHTVTCPKCHRDFQVKI